MRKGLFAFIMIAILLPAGWAETASAWHAVPGNPETDELPQPTELPEDPPFETGIIHVDRTLRETTERVGQVHGVVNETYQIYVADTYRSVHENVSKAANQPLTVYRDGTGGFNALDPDDRRTGGFDDWQVFGTPAWGHNESASFTGASGITTSTHPKGHYPGHAQSLLVSPEIDLRTNFFMENKASQSNFSIPSSVYHSMYYGCDLAYWAPTFTIAVAASLLVPAMFYDPSTCGPYRSLMEHEHFYASLEFHYRHNLGDNPSNPDQVQMVVFTEPPADVADISNCRPPRDPDSTWGPVNVDDGDINNSGLRELDQPCQIVRPKTTNVQQTMMGFRVSSSTDFRMDEGGNHTGYQDWTHATVDLSQWEGQSVWVGFFFTSGAIVNPEAYFSGSRFNTDVDFRGFQLDDLEVKLPAAPVNVGVKALTEPSFNPDPNEYDVPTLNPGDPVPVNAHVTNLGTEARNVTVVTRILHWDTMDAEKNWTLVGQDYETQFTTVLHPVESLELSLEFMGLDDGLYVAHVCVYRNETGELGGDFEYCDGLPVPIELDGSCSDDHLEADPCNQVQIKRFNLQSVTLLEVGEIERSALRIDPGGSLSLRMPVTNFGNAPEDVIVRADLWDVSSETCVAGSCLGGQEPLLTLDPVEQEKTVGAGETVQFEWTVDGSRRGHYALFVRVGDAPELDPRYDFNPHGAHPWDSRHSEVTGTEGFPSDFDWLGSTRHHVRNQFLQQEHVRVINDDDNLYLKVRALAGQDFAFFLNDYDDNDIETGNSGVGVIFDGGDLIGIHHEDEWRLAESTTDVKALSAGDAHSLAVRNDGTVWAWGGGGNGRLGQDDNNDRSTPVEVQGEGMMAAKDVAAGSAHSLALLEDGRIYSWGANGNNQLGRTGSNSQPGPVSNTNGIGALTDVSGISAGASHSLAVSSGSAFAWGNRMDGRLGDGVDWSQTNQDSAVPVRVATGMQGDEGGFLVEVAQVSTGNSHSLALTDDGAVYAWGNGASGRLGNGTSMSTNTPWRVHAGEQGTTSGFLENVVQIAAGDSHSLALTDDGMVYAWGNRMNGRLGDGVDWSQTNQNSPSPVRVHTGEQGHDSGFLTNVAQIAAGGSQSFAITNDGTLYAWGLNHNGQLGIGDTRAMFNVPMRVANPYTASGFVEDAVRVAAGGVHGLSLTGMGLTLAWGNEGNGRLGHGLPFGDNERRNMPIYTMRSFTDFADEGWAIGHNLLNLGTDGGQELTLRIPIGAPENGEVPRLTAGPGDEIGVLIRWCANIAPAPPCGNHPAGAPLHDGEGYHLPDGSLANELRQWQTIRIGETGTDGTFTHRAMSLPFGVQTDPPPYFFEDFNSGTACSSFLGWSQMAAMNQRRPLDHWRCGLYPDDGRVLLYKGQGPCESDCLPYSTQPGEYTLRTAPFFVPTEARTPTLHLTHQFSTDIVIDDHTGQIVARDRLNISLEVWNTNTNRWEDRILLEPLGGYTDEERAGITDSRFTREFPEGSWWWPQGDQSDYRPLDRRLAVGGEFHGGSPWRTDLVPLYGGHFDLDRLDVAGRLVRILFNYEQDNMFIPPDVDHDWGWRIGGIAVIDQDPEDGARFGRDLSITSVIPDVSFDPYQIGFGPGTLVPFQVTLHNDGWEQIGFRNEWVRILSIDSESRQTMECSGAQTTGVQGNGELRGSLDPEQTLTLRVWCRIPDEAGSQISIIAALDHPGSDYSGNHQQRVPGTFVIQEARRVALHASGTPGVDTMDTSRRLVASIENAGNVPLETATVTRTISRVTEQGLSPLQVHSWTLDPSRHIPIGRSITLSSGSSGNMIPSEAGQPPIDIWTGHEIPRTGTYIVEFIVEVADEFAMIRDRSIIRLEALEQLYTEIFDGPAHSAPGLVRGNLTIEGTPSVWNLTPSNRGDGSMTMRAGNPVTGELPANTSAMIRLPTLDLGALKRATLTFDHRYDLEEMYDAGRVEMSIDGGETWHPVIPEPQHPDLPDGYPSQRLIGLNAHLQDSQEVELFAGAFTGMSEGLTNLSDDHGWITTEIDLTRQPAFWIDEDIEIFPLTGHAPFPEFDPLRVNVKDPFDLESKMDWRFTHSTWSLPEESALAQERYWWIQNVTYSEPRPLDGNTMWWSGALGEFEPEERPSNAEVDWAPQGADPNVTSLIFGVDPAEADERIVVSFWDWRAGWKDTDNPSWGQREREGTGGSFEVRVAGQVVAPQIIERRPDGWTKREIDISGMIGMSGTVTVDFNYTTGPFTEDVSAQFSSQRPDLLQCHFITGGRCSQGVWLSLTQNNRGWFVDGLTVRADGTERLIEPDLLDPKNVEGTILWSQVQLGETTRDGGWHLDDVEVPRHGEQNVWRFADDSGQGYPSNADSRLVTPKVDLTVYSGDRVFFTFDHKYDFHGENHRCVDYEDETQLPDWDPSRPCSDVDVGRAIDGGAVEYQVYDELTGTWGPWQQLHGKGENLEIGFQRPDEQWVYKIDMEFDDGSAKSVRRDRFLGLPEGIDGEQVDDLRQIGYPSVMHFPSSGGTHYSRSGLGAGFATSEAWIRGSGSYAPYQMAYVFSGEGDWTRSGWDASHLIGQQVRFAFHAWTNPSGEPCYVDEYSFYRMGWDGRSSADGGGHHRGYLLPCDRFQADAQSLDGWTIANVGLQGQRFRGQEAEIRFHVATDESNTKGEWSIGNIRLSGEQYGRAVVFETDSRHILDSPGNEVIFEGSVRNLGTEVRQGLAIAIDARRADTGAPVDIELIGGSLGLITDPDLLPEWIQEARGPFSLLPLTEDPQGSELPLRLSFDLPAEPARIVINLNLLEEVTIQGSCERVEGELKCETTYVPVVNERGTALAETTWVAEGADLLDYQLLSLQEGRGTRLLAEPDVVPLGETTEIRAMVLNNGTSMDSVELQWIFQEVLRKGCPSGGSPCDQPGTQELLGEAVLESQEISLERGDSAPFEQSFTPPREGLYRIVLQIRDQVKGSLLDQATVEILAGHAEPYYFIDFALTNATDHDWVTAGPGVAPKHGTSPSELRFRQVGEQFIWGVSREQFQQGLHYCDEQIGAAGGCNPMVDAFTGEEAQNRARENAAYGLEAMTLSPLVDLGNVLGDQAIMTLRQGHSFQDRDGAVVEVILFESPVGHSPRSAYRCVDGNGESRAAWFRMNPEQEEKYPEITRGYRETQLQTGVSVRSNNAILGWIPPRVNPLDHIQPPAGSPAIGGPGMESQVIRFRLGDPSLEPVCDGDGLVGNAGGEDPPVSLVNYTVQFRLRVGTTPLSVQNPNCDTDWTQMPNGGNNPQDNRGRCDDMARTRGAMGWQIDGIGITSLDVSVNPRERHLPIVDGYPKLYGFHLENTGVVSEAYEISLESDPEDPVSEWVSLHETEVHLVPGERRIIPFHVDIPAEPPQERGEHPAVIRATSVTDPGIFDEVLIRFDLLDHNLPDLELQLSATGREEALPTYEVGSLAEFVATVTNRGHASSEEVRLLVEAVHGDDENETRMTVFTTMVPALCPLTDAECEDQRGGRREIPFNFNLPDLPGLYRIEAIVDPEGRLVQESVTNSRSARLVEAIPLQRPDLAVTGLELGGVREDGYALEGTTVRVVVNITNQGVVTATGGELNVRSGAALIVDRRPLPTLPPGHTHQVFVNLSGLSPGEIPIRANIIPATVVPQDLDATNMEMMRVLRVRGLDLQVSPPPEPLALAPGQVTTTRVTLQNEGNAVERVLLELAPEHSEWGFAATPNPVTVAPNATAWAVLTIRASENATAGEYGLGILATPMSRPTAWQETQIPVRVSPLLDAPLVRLLPLESPPGIADFVVVLESRSNTVENLSVSLSEPDWSLGAQDVTLPSDQAMRVQLSLQIPAHTRPGDYVGLVQIHNGTGALIVGAPAMINVTQRPNAHVEWGNRILSPATDLVARLFEVPMNVTNTGNVPFTPEVVITGLSEAAEYKPPESWPVVEPGETVEMPIRLQVQAEFTKRIHGEVEVFMGIDKEVQGNATRDLMSVTRMPLPDLAALPDLEIGEVSLRPRTGATPGQPVQVSLTVRNSGFVNAPPTQLHAFVNGEFVEEVPLPGLAPGGETEVNLTWAFPRSGEWLIHVQADGPGELTEIHDDNNGWTHVFLVERGGINEWIQESPAPPALSGLLVLLGAALLTVRRNRTKEREDCE